MDGPSQHLAPVSAISESLGMSIEEELDETLLANYERAGREVGYWGRRFLLELRRKGGLATMKRVLHPARSKKLATGLQALIDAGRTELSIEATALDPRFHTLFSSEELAEAEHRSANLPTYARRRAVSPESIFPDEVEEDGHYLEGGVRRVVVNAYERDHAARDACIARHGARCMVCKMSFLEQHGEIGRGFIHIHHRKPLALRRARYQLDPRKDLVPVCPNCHAMLHTSNPPLGIDELYQLLSGARRARSPAGPA